MSNRAFNIGEIERIFYIWSRYEGTRDATPEGKHYSKSDVQDLIWRLSRFNKNPDSFVDGFEREEDEKI